MNSYCIRGEICIGEFLNIKKPYGLCYMCEMRSNPIEKNLKVYNKPS